MRTRVTKTTKLRQEARGRECQVRLEGVCNGNSDSVVLAHYRIIGISGAGQKPPDWCGAWACAACHDVLDKRDWRWKDFGTDKLRAAFGVGMARTLYELSKEGWSFNKNENGG